MSQAFVCSPCTQDDSFVSSAPSSQTRDPQAPPRKHKRTTSQNSQGEPTRGAMLWRGRSPSVMYQEGEFLLDKTLSQSQNSQEFNCTPSTHAEPWQHQEISLPPTPNPRKKMRPMDNNTTMNLQDLGSNLPTASNFARRANTNPFLCSSGESIDTSFAESTISSVSSSLSTPQVYRFRDDFARDDNLGRGHGGSVSQSKHLLDGWEYAVKTHRDPLDSEHKKREALKEVFAYSALAGCPNIVRYCSSWFDEALSIQVELCELGTLRSMREKIVSSTMTPTEKERNLVAVLTQGARALRYMHALEIAHLDVKPDNILLTKAPLGSQNPFPYVLKLADFGLATSTVVCSSGYKEGDKRYCCPELIENSENVQRDQLKRCDIFSLGATIYELATGSDFTDDNEAQAVRCVTDVDAPMPNMDQYSQPFCRLLARMLHRDPQQRPCAAELLIDEIVVAAETDKLLAAKDRVIALSTMIEEEERRISRIESRRPLVPSSVPAKSRVTPRPSPWGNTDFTLTPTSPIDSFARTRLFSDSPGSETDIVQRVGAK